MRRSLITPVLALVLLAACNSSQVSRLIGVLNGAPVAIGLSGPSANYFTEAARALTVYRDSHSTEDWQRVVEAVSQIRFENLQGIPADKVQLANRIVGLIQLIFSAVSPPATHPGQLATPKLERLETLENKQRLELLEKLTKVKATQ